MSLTVNGSSSSNLGTRSGSRVQRSVDLQSVFISFALLVFGTLVSAAADALVLFERPHSVGPRPRTPLDRSRGLPRAVITT